MESLSRPYDSLKNLSMPEKRDNLLIDLKD